MPQERGADGKMLAYVPNDLHRRLVVCAKENGYSNETIAKTLEMTVDTLVKYYKQELEAGRELSIIKVTDRFRQAFLFNDDMLEKDPKVVASAIQFYLKAKGGWKETQAIEAQVTQLQEDSELAKKIEKLDIDALIQLGKGLDKATEG